MAINCGESEGLVKILIDLSYVTEMASGSSSEVYQDLLFGRVLSSMGMVGKFKYFL